MLVRAPLVLLGVAGLVVAKRWREGLAIAAFVALLSFHRTPWGGASEDHRYLVPVVPLVGIGLAAAWHRWASPESSTRRIAVASMLVLTTCSAVLAWAGFIAAR